MRVLILSGGSNKGAMQVGALRALLENNISFDLVIGVSIGSLNGTYFCYKPDLEGIIELEKIWLNVKPKEIFKDAKTKVFLRILRNKESLFDNEGLYKFVIRNLPVRTFSELKIKLLIPAVDILSNREYIFGENPFEMLIDAIMSSTAIPPFFPPYKYKNMELVDGGFYSNLPYEIAINKGAKEIYALHIVGQRDDERIMRVLRNLSYSVDYLLKARIKEQENILRNKKVKLHYVELKSPFKVSILDFSKTRELIDLGYKITLDNLKQLSKKQKSVLERIKEILKIWL